jgi:hypothetical protein
MALVIGLAMLVAGCVFGRGARYFMIEPAAVHALCAASLAPGWCDARALLIAVTFRGTWGIAAVAGAAAAWLLRGRVAAACAVMALFAGGLGLYLYDTSWAASGILAALLRLARVAEDPPDPREFTA